MICVRAFARYRETLGFTTVEVPLPEPATLGVLLSLPLFQALPEDALLALNRTFAGREAGLVDGDEVALMPPVSGG
jgi:molybdopterin converting factor small subunit